MTEDTNEDLILDDDDLDDLNRRMAMAENRLNAVRSHRLMRQHESLELLTKIEERFVQQRNDLLNAQDHIRRLERMNQELQSRLRRLVGAVEAGMDAADDIFYRMVNVTNEIANFSNQSLTGEYHSHAMLDGLDLEGEGAVDEAADSAADAAVEAEVVNSDDDSGEDMLSEAAEVSSGPTIMPRRSTLDLHSTRVDPVAESGAQVLDIKAIFSKG